MYCGDKLYYAIRKTYPTSAGNHSASKHIGKIYMSIKSTIAAVAASPFLFAGAAFAGPYVNLEATGSYPDAEYASGGLDWYASVGPTVPHTETADDFGDVEIAGYLGGSYGISENLSAYAEIYGQTTPSDDNDFSGKVGAKFSF